MFFTPEITFKHEIHAERDHLLESMVPVTSPFNIRESILLEHIIYFFYRRLLICKYFRQIPSQAYSPAIFPAPP